MKTSTLIAALNAAKSSLGPVNGILAVLAHFCFDDDVLYAYNDVTAIIVPEKTGLVCALHGSTLLDLMQTCEGDLTPEMRDSSVLFKFKGGKVEVPMLPKGSFLFELPDDAQAFTLPISDAFRAGLKLCAASIGSNTLTPEFNGVTLQVQNGKQLILYSSDNHTASRHVSHEKMQAAGHYSCVIPTEGVDQLLKMQEGKEAQAAFGTTTMTAAFPWGDEEIILFSKLRAANPTMFEKMFSTHETGAKYHAIPVRFQSEIQKATILVGTGPAECIISFGAERMSIVCEGQRGKMDVVLPCPGAGNDRIVINPEYVLRVLGAVDSMALANGALLFQKGGYTHIIAGKSQIAKELNAPTKQAVEGKAPKGKPKPATDDDGDDIPF